MPKAFVSYTRQDKKFVDEHIRPILNALNIDIWIDTRDLHGAERWTEAIASAMPECDVFLLVATKAAAASPAVRGEVEWILKNRSESLIPILAERSRFDAIHSDLAHIQHVDCVDRKPTHSAVYIAKALVHLLDRRMKTLEQQKLGLAEALERQEKQWDEANRQLTSEISQLQRELSGLNKQLDQILEFDGDWRRPPLGVPAAFVPLAERKAKIIAIMNVKGGVGKSSIAANLAATWWGQPKRSQTRPSH